MLTISAIALSVLRGDDTPRCPPPDVTYPCVCSESTHSLICIGQMSNKLNQTYDLAKTFSLISKTQATSPEGRNFKKLMIANSKTLEFNETFFSNITFKKLFVFESSLLRIHSKVFFRTYSTVEEVYMNLGSVKDNQQNYNLFEALSSLPKLESLYIDFGQNSVTSVPDRAFRAVKGVQTELKEISISGNIETIGQLAFAELPNLKKIRIQSQVYSIGNQSFEYKSSSSEELKIDLSFNQLMDNSFQPNSLSNIRRPVNLILSHNKLKFLEKSVFEPFLSSNKKNKLSLTGNPLNCTDCRSYWMVRQKSKLKHRLREANCASGGKPIWEEKWNCTKNSSYFSTKLSFVLMIFVVIKTILI